MIPFSRPNVFIGHATYMGEHHEYYRTRHIVTAFRATNEEEVTLAVLAEGTGGFQREAWVEAADLTVQVIAQSVAQSFERDYCITLARSIHQASRAIAARNQSYPDDENIAAVCAVALIAGRRLYTAYVGHCRLYLAHNRIVRQTSIDHTWIEAAIEQGLITREEAKTHLDRHAVIRNLGNESGSEPDFRLYLADNETREQAERNQGMLLEPGDMVLVGSPWIKCLEDSDILSAVANHEPQTAADELVHRVRESNSEYAEITIIVIQVPPSA